MTAFGDGLAQGRQRRPRRPSRAAAGAAGPGAVGVDRRGARRPGARPPSSQAPAAGASGGVTATPARRAAGDPAADDGATLVGVLVAVGASSCWWPSALAARRRRASPPTAMIAVRRLRADPELAGHARGRPARARLPHRRPARLGGSPRPLHDPGTDTAGRDRQRAAGPAGRPQGADPRPALADPGRRGPGRGLGGRRSASSTTGSQEARIAAGPDRADRDRDRHPARGFAGAGPARRQRVRLPRRLARHPARGRGAVGRRAPRRSRSTASGSRRPRRSSTSGRRCWSTRPTSRRRTRSRRSDRADLYDRLSASPGFVDFVRGRGEGLRHPASRWRNPTSVDMPAFVGTVTLRYSRPLAIAGAVAVGAHRRGRLTMHRPRSQLTIAAVALVLGLLVVVQLRSQAGEPGLAQLSSQDLTVLVANLNARNDQLRREVVGARAASSRRSTANRSRGDASIDEIAADLERVRAYAGLDPVGGPASRSRSAARSTAGRRGADQRAAQRRRRGDRDRRRPGRDRRRRAGPPGDAAVDGVRARRPFELAAVGAPDKLTGSLTRSGGVIAQLAATAAGRRRHGHAGRPARAAGDDPDPRPGPRSARAFDTLTRRCQTSPSSSCSSATSSGSDAPTRAAATPGWSTAWAPTSGCAARPAAGTCCSSAAPLEAPARRVRLARRPGADGARSRPGRRPSDGPDGVTAGRATRGDPATSRRAARSRSSATRRSCGSGCRRRRPRSAATWSSSA